MNGEDDASILEGKYEGIYSWLTLNYALSNIFKTKKFSQIYSFLFVFLGSFENLKEHSVCSLDLGGGSTQITFIPTDQVEIWRYDC